MSVLSNLTGEFRVAPFRTLLAARADGRVLVGRRFRVLHPERIRGRINLGTIPFGFVDPRIGGLVRVLGRLSCVGADPVSVAHGASWYIGPEGVVEIGSGTYFSPRTTVIAMNRITIGESCAISWDVQLMDDNHHPLTIDGRPSPREGSIRIGDHVWVGSGSTILKDTVIGDGCVVAAGSVVKGDFSAPGRLIGGVPAKVLRSDVTWSA